MEKNNTENIKAPKGEVSITLTDRDGNVKEVYYENLIMNEFGRFLAMCCDNPLALNSGITWIAMGLGVTSGLGTWNPALPPAPDINATTLEQEVCRKLRPSVGGVVFKDPTNPTVAIVGPATSSRVIDIKWSFDYAEGNNFAFQELGMIANSSMAAIPTYKDIVGYPTYVSSFTDADRGILVNKKHFPVFTKTSQWKMDITYRLTFGG